MKGIKLMKVFLSCDHAGIELKNELCAYISEKVGFEAVNLGIELGERIDYPIAAENLCKKVLEEKALGILVCGTGIGMSMAANKVNGIRAAAVSEPYSAKLTRVHNDANVLCMGARVVGTELAKMIVDSFLYASFEGGRHQTRVDLITDIENRN